MATTGMLDDAYSRIRQSVHGVVEGASDEILAYRPDRDANSIAWLVWHLARVQDDHIAEAFGHEQVWTAAGWRDRFGLPFAPEATGYGMSSSEVGEVSAGRDLLLGYYDAVHERTLACIASLTEQDLGRIVDESWDPPVTLAIRLNSVLADDLQHAGQAAYVRGLAERSGL